MSSSSKCLIKNNCKKILLKIHFSIQHYVNKLSHSTYIKLFTTKLKYLFEPITFSKLAAAKNFSFLKLELVSMVDESKKFILIPAGVNFWSFDCRSRFTCHKWVVFSFLLNLRRINESNCLTVALEFTGGTFGNESRLSFDAFGLTEDELEQPNLLIRSSLIRSRQ